MGAPVFLLIDRLSKSLNYRPYFDRFGQGTFLNWWINRFASRYPKFQLVILAAKSSWVAAPTPPQRSGAVFLTETVNKLGMLAEAAAHFHTKISIACTLGFAFAPRDLLRIALQHHLRRRNNYTLIHGLPFGVAPEIYSSDLLRELLKLRLPGLPNDPAVALERLAEARERLGEQEVFELKHVPLKASAIYHLEAGTVPERIIIQWRRDLDIASEVLEAANENDDPLAELKLWRKVVIRRKKEARERVHILAYSRPGDQANGTPRILLVSNQSAFSGAEESLCQVAKFIDPRRFALFAAIGAKGLFTDRLERAGVNVIIGDTALGDTPAQQSLYLASVLHRVRPNIVHFNGLAHPHFPGIVTALGIPFIAHFRVADPVPFGDQLRMAKKIIAVSEYAKRQALRLDVDACEIEVIYDEVDTEEFTPDRFPGNVARASFSLPTNAFVLLAIARFAPNKRHDLLIKAAIQAKSHIPEMILIIKGESFGDSSTLDEVSKLIHANGLANWIRIIPFVDDICLLHAASDALVLCSDREALGRCVVEAMSMAKPVIVSDSGGTHEIIEHGRTGFVVTSENPDAWSQQIVEAAGASKVLKVIGLRARAFAKEKLDARISADRVMAIYGSILENCS